MFVFFENRHFLLSLMPQGCTIAEIGVREGNNAKWMFKSNPGVMHLVDPWKNSIDEDYAYDLSGNAGQDVQDMRYSGVIENFHHDIETKRVVVHKKRSLDALKEFPDEYFDWVFLDAMHYYNAVYDDINALIPKIKNDGVIIGHDFCEHRYAKDMNFGVIGAVNAVTKRTGLDLFAMNVEFPCDETNLYPMFFLSKKANGRIKNRIIKNFIKKAINFIEIPNEIAWSFSYKERKGGWYPSFSL